MWTERRRGIWVRATFALVALAAAATAALPASGRGLDRFPNIEIYSLTLAGRQQNLTMNPALDTAPATSPNGREVAFVSSRAGQPDLYVMDASGGNVRRLTTSPFTASAPGSQPEMVAWGEYDAGTTTIAWSPDRRRLAFVALNAIVSPDCFQECHTASVFVVNADGSGLQFVADGRLPAWSPKGKALAYQGDVSPFGESDAIYITRLGGSGSVRIAAFNPDSTMPAWSPDGKRIAFQVVPNEQSGRRVVDLVDANGSHRRQLTIGEDPAWSPAGLVAFLRSGRLHVLGANGKHDRVLSRRGARAIAPSWSPQGTRIAFLVQPKAANSLQVATVNVKTGRERQLVHEPAHTVFDAGPVWAPAGNKLLLAFWIQPSGKHLR
jgi:Tol biopolymer transport system component